MTIWPNRKIPVVFCHVKGEEKSLSVATEEGHEQSKSNEAERFQVVSVKNLARGVCVGVGGGKVCSIKTHLLYK